MKKLLYLCLLLTGCSQISLYKKALVLEKTKQYAKAVETYNLAIKNEEKNNSLAFTGRGHCKYHLNDFKGCINDMSQAIKLNTKNARAYDLKGLCEYKMKDYKSAIQDFSQSLKLEPNNKLAQKDLNDCKKLLEKSN